MTCTQTRYVSSNTATKCTPVGQIPVRKAPPSGPEVGRHRSALTGVSEGQRKATGTGRGGTDAVGAASHNSLTALRDARARSGPGPRQFLSIVIADSAD